MDCNEEDKEELKESQKKDSLIAEKKKDKMGNLMAKIKQEFGSQVIKITGRLENFSVWMPSNANDPHSQIIALSYMSDIHYKRIEEM